MSKDDKIPEEHWHLSRTFHRKPGLILSPYESLQAILMCMGEAIDNIKKGAMSPPFDLHEVKPRVHHTYRRKLLNAFLLYGYFDAVSGMTLVDRYLLLHGRMESRREVFGDLLQSYEKYSPFAHSLESSLFTTIHPFTAAATDDDAVRFVPAIVRALKRAGYTVDMKGTCPENRLRYSHEAYKSEIVEELQIVAQASRKMQMAIFHTYLNTLVLSCFAMIDRAIQLERPLFSTDAVGPAWISNAEVDSSIRILEIVWEEIGWLPQPTSFHEARIMLEDERIQGLQRDIQLWSHAVAVGDLLSEKDLRASIRETVRAFNRKTWAAKVSRFTTYIAVPVGVADLLSGGLTGLIVSGVGAAAQLISDKLEKNNRTHWLSLGRDYDGL